MGGPEMAPQTPQPLVAPRRSRGAPRPPHAGGAPAKPWHPSILRQADLVDPAHDRLRRRPQRVQHEEEHQQPHPREADEGVGARARVGRPLGRAVYTPARLRVGFRRGRLGRRTAMRAVPEAALAPAAAVGVTLEPRQDRLLEPAVQAAAPDAIATAAWTAVPGAE